MDQDPSLSPWPENLHDDPLVPTTTDDFSSLLEFNFDLAEFDNVVGRNDQNILDSGSHTPTTMMQDVQLTQIDNAQQASNHPTQFDTSVLDQTNPMDMQEVNTMQHQMDSDYYIQKQQQSIFPQNYGHPFIPPTPNSVEMQGASRTYPLRVETGHQRGYEPYTRSLEDQSAFTPHLSPVMTPLEQQLRFPEYATPGEYLTPLTSPAIEALSSNGGYPYNNNSQFDLGFVTSPADVSHRPPPPQSAGPVPVPSSPSITQKQRRKSLASRSTGRITRQSPSVRPVASRHRTQAGTHNDTETRTRNRNQFSSQVAANRASISLPSSSHENSGQDSVSPESLTEPLMPPPALPRSTRSPNIGAQESSSKSREAATPATLMKLQNQQVPSSPTGQFSRSGSVTVSNAPDEAMEDISLPEPVANPDRAAQTSDIVTTNDQTPKLAAKPAPALRPHIESSERPGMGSITPSPNLRAMASPSGPVGAKKRAESKPSSKVSKKRQSVSSAQASPALRPKISPSIQPMIRNDGISSETSALYLASKSNYQHIMEGTVLPGVNYPDTLVENLSSKRTNHKLAEQGRRNRINTALKEIEGLLPAPLTAKYKEKERRDSVTEAGTSGSSKSPKIPANQPISKASTVEMAIIYIKALQEELGDTKNKLHQAESRLKDYNTTKPESEPGSQPANEKKLEESQRSPSAEVTG